VIGFEPVSRHQFPHIFLTQLDIYRARRPARPPLFSTCDFGNAVDQAEQNDQEGTCNVRQW